MIVYIKTKWGKLKHYVYPEQEYLKPDLVRKTDIIMNIYRPNKEHLGKV